MFLENSMRLYKRSLILAVSIIALVGVLAIRSHVDPHDLTKPLAITSARAWADGGSIEVQVLGANGKRLTIERIGSMKVDRLQQKMYLVNHIFGLVPLRRLADKNSRLDIETNEMLESWLMDSLPETQRTLLNKHDVNALRDVRNDVIIVYGLVYWMNERH